MFKHLDPITEGLSNERETELINKIASKVIEAGMIAPTIMFLETIKPVTVVGSYSVLLFSAPILAVANIDGYELVALFRKRENIEKLIKKI